jgi:6-phosphogluconate dehydrogenase
MKIGIVGLGKMGLHMAARLMKRGHTVVGTDRRPAKTKKLEEAGGEAVKTCKELAAALDPPRVVWLMVAPGSGVDQSIGQLLPQLVEGDLIIDGGNSHYKESIRRAAELEPKGIAFLDVGTSGGISGSERGFNLTVGGADADFRRAEPILKDLASDGGYLHTGLAGSGHFAKMIHNGIASALLQAYGEGFEILCRSRFSYDLKALAQTWNRGSAIRSWLLELSEAAFEQDPRLTSVRESGEDTDEGRWTAEEALDLEVSAPVLTLSLLASFASRTESSFAARLATALRHDLGGEPAKKVEA